MIFRRLNACFDTILILKVFLIRGIWFSSNEATLYKGVLLEVTSPRKPCRRWTKKYNSDELRLFILRKTLGGFFCKVLNNGIVSENDNLILYKRIQSKWSLKLIGDRLYSKHNDDIYDFDCWNGTDEELLELSNLNTLANKDWKYEINRILDERNSDQM